MILIVDTTYAVWACPCGQRMTFYYDHGSASTKCGPFSFDDGQTLTFRFDNDGGNAGTIETITLHTNQFADIGNVTTDELVSFLNANLLAGEALNDFNTVLVRSKTTGPTSCVEIPDGSARPALGVNITNMNSQPHCCGRICLGYRPIPFAIGREYPDTILLRPCSVCGGQTSLFMNNTPQLEDEELVAFNIRQSVLVLGKVLYDNHWLDPDLIDFFNSYTPSFAISNYTMPFEVCSWEEALSQKLIGVKLL